MLRHLFVAALLSSLSAPALAQECPRPEGWAKPARHAAARLPRFRFGLKPNTSALLELNVQRSVVLATKEGKEGWLDRYAGLAALDVEKPGRIDVLLSNRAYVDLVKDGQTLKSVDHGRLNCNGIFKRVSFDVQPGRHALQITGSQAKFVRVATVTR
jgi:hypothetical protein